MSYVTISSTYPFEEQSSKPPGVSVPCLFSNQPFPLNTRVFILPLQKHLQTDTRTASLFVGRLILTSLEVFQIDKSWLAHIEFCLLKRSSKHFILFTSIKQSTILWTPIYILLMVFRLIKVKAWFLEVVFWLRECLFRVQGKTKHTECKYIWICSSLDLWDH
jgi:hypothetical protein